MGFKVGQMGFFTKDQSNASSSLEKELSFTHAQAPGLMDWHSLTKGSGW